MKKNPGFQTHYDNLKVSQDAPYEIIQAAYRTLAKKYHPDLNKQDPECARIMKIINESYVVLSDPEKRRQHDSWITKEKCKRAARTVLTGMCYSVGSATRQGSSSLTRFIGQSAMTLRT